MTLENYAMKILADHGCDCYSYGGKWCENVLDDLKEEYPNGMEFPYVDVANAILNISKPKPIYRAPYLVNWYTDTWDDGADCESFGQAKCDAEDTLLEWMAEESRGWAYRGQYEEFEFLPTEEQKDSWDYMIYNCGVSVYKYNPQTDEYDMEWEPSDEELRVLGWKPFNEE